MALAGDRLLGLLVKALANRIVLVILATGAAISMLRPAHALWLEVGRAHGFGSDFHGTIWAADRAVLHGASPYPSASTRFAFPPAVYLPPIFLGTLPLGWLSLQAAIWVWFGCLLAVAFAVLAVLGVRDPWCYALFMLSFPLVEALVLGNASILLALGAALAWRFRHRPMLGPLAVAATVAVKFWLWPLFVWLALVRLRSGLRSALFFAALTLSAWAAIGFRGLFGYPSLMRTEERLFAPHGVFLVGALIQENVGVTLAVTVGLFLGFALLLAAWIARSNEITSFSLALLASLLATPVSWPQYLLLMAVPLLIVWRTMAFAWVWFPALWHPLHAGPLTWSLYAALPAVFVVAAAARRPLARSPDFAGGMSQFADT